MKKVKLTVKKEDSDVFVVYAQVSVEKKDFDEIAVRAKYENDEHSRHGDQFKWIISETKLVYIEVSSNDPILSVQLI